MSCARSMMFVVPGKAFQIKCQSISAGVCVYGGNPDWWGLEIEIPSWELKQWQNYEKAALDLIKKFSMPDSSGHTTKSPDAIN